MIILKRFRGGFFRFFGDALDVLLMFGDSLSIFVISGIFGRDSLNSFGDLRGDSFEIQDGLNCH